MDHISERPGQLRKTKVRLRTVGAGLAEGETESQLTVNYIRGVATVGELPVSQEGPLESGLETSR